MCRSRTRSAHQIFRAAVDAFNMRGASNNFIANQKSLPRAPVYHEWSNKFLRKLSASVVFLSIFFWGCSQAEEPVEVQENGHVILRLTPVKTLHFDSEVTGFAWSPNGQLFATSENWDRVVKLWNATTWNLEKVLLNGKKWRGSDKVLFSSDGKYVITSSPEIGSGKSREALVAIDVASGQIAHSLEGPNEVSGPSGWPMANRPNRRFSMSPKGDRLYAVFPSRTQSPDFCVFDLKTWSTIDCWVSRRGVGALLGGPSEDQFITSNFSGQVEVWDFPKRQMVLEFHATSATLNAMALDPAGRLLATGEGSHGSRLDEKLNKWVDYGEDAIRLWDIKTGKLVRSIRSPPDIDDIAFSRSGRYLIADARVRPTRRSHLDLHL